MGRKRADSDRSQAAPGQAALAAAGASGGRGPGEQGAPPGPAPGPGGQRGDKTQGVRQAVAQGITSPKDIVDYVRRTQGLEISPSYASGLKNQLLKEQGAAKRQTGRKPRQEANDEQEGRPAPTPAAASAVSPASGLTPRDLAALGEIAQRVGGVDRLREFLDLLKKIR